MNNEIDKKSNTMDKIKSIPTKMSRTSILKMLNFDRNINKKDIVFVDPKKDVQNYINSLMDI